MINPFRCNRLAGHISYLANDEVAPHPWDKSYYLTKDTKSRTLRGLANSCLHRGYRFVDKRQKLTPGEALYCEFHAWTYDRGGKLLTTPGFDKEVTCRKLPELDLIDVNGFFFDSQSLKPGAASSIAKFFDVPEVSQIWLDDYMMFDESATSYSVGWRTFMEIYLDGYHVKPFHPGLGTYLNCDYMYWHFGDEFSLQVNDLCAPGTVFPSNTTWNEFYDEVRRVGWDEKWGAMFGTIYPGLMIEFYPHLFVISQLVPTSGTSVVNHVQLYADAVVADDAAYKAAFIKGYIETAREDGDLQDLLEAGRTGWYDIKSLPAHGQFEAGVKHLEAWEAKQARIPEFTKNGEPIYSDER